MMKSYKRSISQNLSKGFTLIELLVVIAIIGLLASVILASLNSARAKGRDARRIADIKSIQSADELFFNDYLTYASSTSLLTPLYIPSLPKDPSSVLSYAYAGLNGNTSGTAAAACLSYHLGAKLEQSTNPALSGDFDATVGGTYGTGVSDGTVCTGGSWTTNTDITASSGDFAGTDPVYDLRP